MGRAVAALFAAGGGKVVIAGRRAEQGEAVAGEIRSAGGDTLFVRTDVNLPSDVEAMVAKTVESFGRLDMAVNLPEPGARCRKTFSYFIATSTGRGGRKRCYDRNPSGRSCKMEGSGGGSGPAVRSDPQCAEHFANYDF